MLIVTVAIIIDDGIAIDSLDTTLLMHTNDFMSFTNAVGGAMCVKQVHNINYQ